jgi:hypothetical protein
MKRLFKTVLTIVVLIAWHFTSAQEDNLTLGVKGGFGMSTFQDTQHTKSKPGLVAGVTVDYNIASGLYILSGIEYIVKGTKVDGGGGNGDRANLNYLQLPVHIGYKYELMPGIKLVADIGPYLAYGIGGEIKYKAIGNTEAYETNSFDNGVYKRFDLGMGLGVGAEVNQINIRIGYDYGMLKIQDFSAVKDIQNASVTFTLGYKF